MVLFAQYGPIYLVHPSIGTYCSGCLVAIPAESRRDPVVVLSSLDHVAQRKDITHVGDYSDRTRSI